MKQTENKYPTDDEQMTNNKSLFSNAYGNIIN